MLLTGLFTGAVLALQIFLTLDQFGARPSSPMSALDGEVFGACAPPRDAGRSRRL